MKKKMKFRGRFRGYMCFPLYFTIVLVGLDAAAFKYDNRFGFVGAGCTALYLIIALILFSRSRTVVANEVVNIATQYASVQKKLLNEFEIPYALLDYSGKILWVNDQFCVKMGIDKKYKKSITTLFPAITREFLQKDDMPGNVYVDIDDKNFRIALKRIGFNTMAEDSDVLDFEEMEEFLTALYLFDETELTACKKEIEEEKQVESKNRVKARVKAQALQDIIEGCENVLIMGHSISDIDSLGAGIGIYCAAKNLGKKAQLVINDPTSSIRPLMDTFTVEKGYPEDMFINSEIALEMVNKNTLVMVVDTNRPSYTECPELLKRSGKIVVFDHHRQNSEVVENPILSYIEPYASSACEMVAEVLQYFNGGIKINATEADCIYAGILIDTNNFMTKTGVRTFEAAAFLKRSGAEVTRVRKMLRNDMACYKARAEAVRHAEVYRGAFAISVCPSENIQSPTIVGAQAANELLNIIGIKASFVLTEYNGKIYVSSRSIDEINVQLIMEKLGGGGHLNVAGAQLTDCTIVEAKKMIQNTIDEMLKEGDIES